MSLTNECTGCGASEEDRKVNKPDESTELRKCPLCGSSKCSICDMGDDVPCVDCENDFDDPDEE